MSRLLLIATALVIASNAFVFARVAWNRSGEPQTTLSLTERELKVPYRYSYRRDENSGLQLQLTWRTSEFIDNNYYQSENHSLPISEQKLRELGFSSPKDCDKSDNNRGGRDQARKAWVALEYDGPAHASYVKKLAQLLERRQQEIGAVDAEPEREELETLSKRLDAISNEQSRLYVVEVAPNKNDLSQQSGSQNLILAAQITNQSFCDQKAKQKIIRINITGLLPDTINLPAHFAELHDLLTDKPERAANEKPRYQATIAVGKLNEPWLVRVEK